MKTQRCAWCNQVIRDKRSDDISRRFQAHVTWVTSQLHGQKSRDEVLMLALLKAVEIDPPAGAATYRYSIVDDILYPVSTSSATNKEMMTACQAIEYLAMEWEVGPVPERPNTEAIE